MDFRDSPEESAFRNEVRRFIAAEKPKGFGEPGGPAAGADDDRLRGGVDRFGVYRDWTKKLAKKGWIAPAWPEEYGGAGMTVMQQFIFNEELAMARVPRPGGIGVGFAGPTVITYGNDEQKQQHLPGILSGDDVWCQGFSEPEAGSDLASLRTRAEKDGDDYIINGQKIWTTGAQFAHRMILLARTDPEAPKHKGISYFLLDMKSPGVTIRPLVNMGGSPAFSEVFFDNVRVPNRDLLGEENRGWYVAATTLDFERSSIGNAIAQVNQVDDLIKFVREDKGGRARTHATVKLELAERTLEAETARLLSYRVIAMQNRGLVPNHEASAAKLYSSELAQRIAGTGIKVVGMYGLLDRNSKAAAEAATNRHAPNRGRLMRAYLNAVSATIAGGTGEIQRGIIAHRGLGLPRG
jgi:alkylation response protein AidB-like acyl-CoA dehydrogenase